MRQMQAYRGFADQPVPRLVETEVPEIGDGDVLVKIKSAGLTYGSFSLLKARLLTPMPMTLGHEGAGIVEAVGARVTAAKPGDRVRIHPTITCGRCRHCLTDRDHMCRGSAMMGFISFGATVPDFARYHNGFLAEYAVAPERQIDLLPDHVSFDAGAKLHYAGNALRTLKSAELPPGGSLAILGATGSMGVATIPLAAYFGVSRLVLVGRSTERLRKVAALASVPTDIVATDRMGSDWAETGELGRAMLDTVPCGVDAIIDYLPEGGAMWQAANGLATGGTFVNMGGGPQTFAFPMRTMIHKCWKVVGTRNQSRLDAKVVLGLMDRSALDIEPLITHRDPLSNVAAAFDRLTSRSEPVWMSVVHP